MNNQQEQQRSFSERVNLQMNVLLFVCSALSLPSIVVLHGRLGSRYVGLQALLTIPLIIFWGTAWPNSDPAPLLVFFGIFLFMCFISRIGVLWRYMRGEPSQHRNYDGYPRLLRFFPSVTEEGFKRFEPVIVFGVALFVMSLSESLGSFLMLSAIGLMVSVTAREAAVRDRIDTMRDQEIEQRYIVEKYRRVRGK